MDRVTDFVDLGDAEQVKGLDDFLSASTDSQKLTKFMHLSLVLLSSRRPVTASHHPQLTSRSSDTEKLDALLRSRRIAPSPRPASAMPQTHDVEELRARLEAQLDANIQLASYCRRLEQEGGHANRKQMALRAKRISAIAARLDELRADAAKTALLRQENDRLRAQIRRLRNTKGDPMLAGLDALDDELDSFYAAVQART